MFQPAMLQNTKILTLVKIIYNKTGFALADKYCYYLNMIQISARLSCDSWSQTNTARFSRCTETRTLFSKVSTNTSWSPTKFKAEKLSKLVCDISKVFWKLLFILLKSGNKQDKEKLLHSLSYLAVAFFCMHCGKILREPLKSSDL